MLGPKLTGMLCGIMLMSLFGCQTKPEPCDSSAAVEEMTRFTKGYFHCIADNGNLRQDLKACNERK